MTPIRVLHLNSLLTGGGTDDQCVKLVHGLRQRDIDARLAGPEGRPFSNVAQQLGLPFYGTSVKSPAKIRFILGAARLIRQAQIQIVHGHHGRDVWPTILAARLSGQRPTIVLTRHLAKSPSSWPSRRFLLGQVDTLVAVSKFTARVLRQGHYEPDSPVQERRARLPLIGDHSKIRVIYGGIDTDRFKPRDASELRVAWGLQPGHYTFAMVGGYELPFGKGQREFLQAAAKIHHQAPNARFLIVGRGNMRDLLLAEIKQLHLEGQAQLTPYCEEMPLAMNAIDCLIHSQIGTEAMPGVVCEAQACGRPVIASDLDGIPEAVAIGGVGKLVTPGSVDELARAMAEQANTPRLTAEQQAQMHRRVEEQFSLPVSASNHATLYARLLDAGEAR